MGIGPQNRFCLPLNARFGVFSAHKPICTRKMPLRRPYVGLKPYVGVFSLGEGPRADMEPVAP